MIGFFVEMASQSKNIKHKKERRFGDFLAQFSSSNAKR